MKRNLENLTSLPKNKIARKEEEIAWKEKEIPEFFQNWYEILFSNVSMEYEDDDDDDDEEEKRKKEKENEIKRKGNEIKRKDMNDELHDILGDYFASIDEDVVPINDRPYLTRMFEHIYEYSLDPTIAEMLFAVYKDVLNDKTNYRDGNNNIDFGDDNVGYIEYHIGHFKHEQGEEIEQDDILTAKDWALLYCNGENDKNLFLLLLNNGADFSLQIEFKEQNCDDMPENMQIYEQMYSMYPILVMLIQSGETKQVEWLLEWVSQQSDLTGFEKVLEEAMNYTCYMIDNYDYFKEANLRNRGYKRFLNTFIAFDKYGIFKLYPNIKNDTILMLNKSEVNLKITFLDLVF